MLVPKKLECVKNILQFSDTDIFEYIIYITPTIVKDISSYNSKDAFTLGIFLSEFRYNVRLLKGWITGDSNLPSKESIVDYFLEIVNIAPKIFGEYITKYTNIYSEMDKITAKIYTYDKKDKSRYLLRSDEENAALMNDIYKIWKFQ